jgi:hypothetical protein
VTVCVPKLEKVRAHDRFPFRSTRGIPPAPFGFGRTRGHCHWGGGDSAGGRPHGSECAVDGERGPERRRGIFSLNAFRSQPALSRVQIALQLRFGESFGCPRVREELVPLGFKGHIQHANCQWLHNGRGHTNGTSKFTHRRSRTVRSCSTRTRSSCRNPLWPPRLNPAVVLASLAPTSTSASPFRRRLRRRRPSGRRRPSRCSQEQTGRACSARVRILGRLHDQRFSRTLLRPQRSRGKLLVVRSCVRDEVDCRPRGPRIPAQCR